MNSKNCCNDCSNWHDRKSEICYDPDCMCHIKSLAEELGNSEPKKQLDSTMNQIKDNQALSSLPLLTEPSRTARRTRITAKGYMELAGLEKTDYALTEVQEQILSKLAQIHLELVPKFVGALMTLQGPDYSERMEHAAHSFRAIAAQLARMSTGSEEVAVQIYDGRPTNV